MTNQEYNTARELSAIELDQVSGGCVNCGGGGPGSCPCLPPVPAPGEPSGYSCPVTYVGSHLMIQDAGWVDCTLQPVSAPK
jgi:hypothetical protein